MKNKCWIQPSRLLIRFQIVKMGSFACDIFFYVASFALTIVTSAYLYFKYKFNFWEKRGVKYISPKIFYGNFEESFKQKVSMGGVITKIYKNTKEPFIGLFCAQRPLLLVRDLELLNRIFIKDFHNFVDRGVYSNEKRDPLSAHLFALTGNKWKTLRAKLSPTFTSGKMKAMFPTILACGDSLEDVVQHAAEMNTEIDVREVIPCFATNVIASIAFGIEVDTLKNQNDPFRECGRKVFAPNWKNGVRNLGKFLFPSLMHLLRLKIIDDDIETFFMDVMKQTMDLREKHNVVRKDFFQLLIQLRNTGDIQSDDSWETKISNEGNKQLSFDELAAQAFVFYIAGFETTSTTISFCLYEMARNPEIQATAQQEIDSILKQHNGEITYDSIKEMKYLESCIYETLRKHSPVPFLTRVCANDYKIPGTNITLEKGTAILIPAMAIQHDPKYYPNPEQFDPERFLDGSHKRKPFTELPFLSFGEGPRFCIGVRMGLLETQICLAIMLRNFTYELGDRHIGEELEYRPTAFVNAPKVDFMLKAKKRM